MTSKDCEMCVHKKTRWTEEPCLSCLMSAIDSYTEFICNSDINENIIQELQEI